MGFFRSVRELNRQANEIGRSWDVEAQLQQARTAMASGSAMMAQLTAAAYDDHRLAHAQPATGQVMAVNSGLGSINNDVVIDVALLVERPGLPVQPITLRRAVPVHLLARFVPGATIPLRADGATGQIGLDWAALVTPPGVSLPPPPAASAGGN